MKKAKILLSILLATILVTAQVAVVFAAPTSNVEDLITGQVTAVTLETDISTGVSTVLVELEDTQTVRISEQTAYDLGLLDYDGDGNPAIVDPLPEYIEIIPATVIPDEEESQHPVGSALVTFFADDIAGLDYEAIMDAHSAGNGFGVIAQALWLIRKLGGTVDDFVLLLEAKRDGNYSNFPLEDGTIPTTWGQLKKAVAENLGVVMSQRDHDNNGNGNNGNGHGNNGNGNNGNGHSNNGNHNGNGNGNRP